MDAQLAALDSAKTPVDLSDIAEQADWTGAVRGRFYRPIKQQITLRIDADVLAWFRAQGGKYQTAVNEALRDHVKRQVLAARRKRAS